MFAGISSFNQSLGNWDVSSATNMRGMFYQATSFNQPLDKWDVSSVTDMRDMFYQATSFNQPIENWDVSSVTTMQHMFREATSFNQPIENWSVSSVTSMENMFYQATSFNQPIDKWDVSSVTTMQQMFREATSFNQPIDKWDVSSVTDMRDMFREATSFNQPVDKWDVSSVTRMNGMFDGVALSTPYYNDLLSGWSHLSLQNGVYFDGGNSLYSISAFGARKSIISNFSWTITDGGYIELSSNAGNPDSDGNFDLTWTASPGAFNYSVYRHSSYITEINESLILLASEITDLTLRLSEYANGTHYFIVVAQYDDIDLLLNCISVVVVDLTSGDFILSSNAGNPDNDGNFDLTWTASPRAKNYSVYRHSAYITEINGSLKILTGEISDLFRRFRDHPNGTYYFIVVAHNEYGDTLSNCISIIVLKDRFPSGIPSYDLVLVIATLGITLIFLIKKIKSE